MIRCLKHWQCVPDMSLHLFDTYSRQLKKFEPINTGLIKLYACGPTVYDYAHIGNLRTYIFEDILRRVLEFQGYKVEHVVNITDVGHLTSNEDFGDDKITQVAEQFNKSALEISEFYTKAFKEDLNSLNILEPTIWCKATDHISEQIMEIQKIEKKGYTYRTSDGIYFDTSKLKSYGYLARLDQEGLYQGIRVNIGEKRHKTDFALWKFSLMKSKRQMEWDSPWGIGFPSWHIECSAMAVKYLGPKFDIHCGGKDHISIHHSNEIAQAEVCYGTNLSNFWLHGYFLEIDAKKMSKSSGKIFRLKTLYDNAYDPLAYRYLCLTAHYRKDLKFTWTNLQSASTALNRLRSIVYSWKKNGNPNIYFIDKFLSSINNDLNTAGAMAITWDLVKSEELCTGEKYATIAFLDKILGLNVLSWIPETNLIPKKILELLESRHQARIKKNWVLADEIRNQIISLGYHVYDHVNGRTSCYKIEKHNIY